VRPPALLLPSSQLLWLQLLQLAKGERASLRQRHVEDFEASFYLLVWYLTKKIISSV
jgi:hypothetical protein